MDRTIHKLDPDGDVILILQDPDTPFADWDEGQGSSPAASSIDWTEFPALHQSGKGKKKNKKKKKGGIPSYKSLDPGDKPEPLSPPSPPPPPEDPPFFEVQDASTGDNDLSSSTPEEPPPTLLQSITPPPEQEVEVRMQLSSKHLTLASAYFKRMLQGSWKESTPSSDSCYTINAFEWDTEAMLILMNVIHGHVRSVPRSISLEMLAKIAALVDYYECHEVTALFAECWIRNLNDDLPTEYCRDLLLWLAVSRVFSQETLFTAVTKVVIKEIKRPLQTLGLPISQFIVETIDQQREQLVDQIISKLHELLLYFHNRTNCSFECSSILLGALTRQMHTHDLLNPKPVSPFLGYSVTGITTIVRDFKSPTWGDRGTYYKSHECTLAAFMDPTVCSFGDGIEGLKLEDFKM